MNNQFTLRYLIIILVSGLFFLGMAGCGGDSGSDPFTPPDNQEQLAAETVGPDGGTFGTDNIVVEIPAGSFAGDNEVSIFQVTGESAFGDNSVSPLYKVIGLPDSFSNSIRISIKYESTLSHESYFGSGILVPDFMTGEETTVYQLQAAADSSGFLVGNLTSGFSSSKKKSASSSVEDGPTDAYIELLSDYSSLETAHFTLRFPFSMIGQTITQLAEICENTYTIIFEECGLEETNVERVISINPQDSDVRYLVDNQTHNLFVSFGTDFINAGNFDKIQTFFIYLLFMSHEMIYDDTDWLASAVGNWLMEMVNDDPTYVYPQLFMTYALAPFIGLSPDYNNPFEDDLIPGVGHGIGNTSVIKYLSLFQDFESQDVGTIFNNFESANHLEGLLSVVASSASEWWPIFFEKYINGDIYNIPASFFLENTTDIWDVDLVQETEETFMASDSHIGLYRGLSAKMFEIKLNHDSFSPNSALNLYLDSTSGIEGFSLVLFGVQDGNAVHLGTTDTGSFTVPGLRDKYDSGMRQILVTVVNGNNTGLLDVNLNALINNDLSEITKCIVGIKVFTELHFVNSAQEEDISSVNFAVRALYSASGFFTNNTFTGNYDVVDDWGTIYAGTISATLNSGLDKVTEVSWSGTIDYTNGSYTDLGFSGSNTEILRNDNVNHHLSFGLWGFQDGVDVTQGITSVTYDYYNYNEEFLVYHQWIEGFSSNSHSELYIHFDTD